MYITNYIMMNACYVAGVAEDNLKSIPDENKCS